MKTAVLMTTAMSMTSGVIGVLTAASVASAGTLVRVRRQRDLLARENVRLATEAVRDPLTGLANRRGLHDALDDALSRPGTATTVLYLDLDRFKDLNDRHGHRCGDQALVVIADRLRLCLPDDSTVGRIGGDELVVVLPDAGRADDAVEVAARVRSCLGQPMRLPGADVPVHLTVSIGVASVRPGTVGAGRGLDLLEHADRALRTAKSDGRDQVMVAVTA